MIEISVYNQGCEVEIEMVGHAGYNPGNDIVCAAASMLGQTFAQNLLDMGYRRELCTMRMDPLDKGQVLAYGKANGTVSAIRLETMADTVITGFKLLAEEFPEHIKLQERASPKYGETEAEG